MTAQGFELGLNSFGEVATDAGGTLSDAETVNLPREARARSIELLGREVAPRVKQLLTKEPTHV